MFYTPRSSPARAHLPSLVTADARCHTGLPGGMEKTNSVLEKGFILYQEPLAPSFPLSGPRLILGKPSAGSTGQGVEVVYPKENRTNMELMEHPATALEVSGDRWETAVLANVPAMVPEVRGQRGRTEAQCWEEIRERGRTWLCKHFPEDLLPRTSWLGEPDDIHPIF